MHEESKQEKELKLLFDYQKFQNNPELQELITQSEARFGKELSAEELSFVNAAGEFNLSGGTISNNTVNAQEET